ncbi:hypothetical protein AB4305_19765 [Nocardia sp. 2YAB30]|uniref:hypothetical protein n=1 Tax=unclassified Nocardia TaxID=2637762 RepID=UPI003F9E7F7C
MSTSVQPPRALPLAIISSAPDTVTPQISQILGLVLVLSRVQMPVSTPMPPPAAAPTPLAEPKHDVRPTSSDDCLPPPELLSVVDGLIMFGLAGAESDAVSFQSASAAQVGIDAARARFFPRP